MDSRRKEELEGSLVETWSKFAKCRLAPTPGEDLR